MDGERFTRAWPHTRGITTMISASFIYNKRDYDEEYFQLDRLISEVAKATQGYIGEEAWHNQENGKVCTVYYWEGQEGLHELMVNAEHLKAKSLSSRWLVGYRVIIADVIATYGTSDYDHLLTDQQRRLPVNGHLDGVVDLCLP